MTVEDIFSILEREVAPVKLSDDFCAKFKMYDNSGIIINCGVPVTGALFALDLSENAVSKAEELGFNLIITHHPAIYGGISRFDLKSNSQSRALSRCFKSGISVISMHLNFDAAPQGIDYQLMCGLGGRECKIAAYIEGGGYGRVYEIAPVILADYVKSIKKEFNSERVLVYGAPDKKISRVASFCGAGCDDYNMAFAIKNSADAFVSADMKHHEILALVQSGLAVIVLTHYASENYGFNKIYLKIKQGLGVPSQYYTDGSVL